MVTNLYMYIRITLLVRIKRMSEIGLYMFTTILNSNSVKNKNEKQVTLRQSH
jgi:hypothetical protein